VGVKYNRLKNQDIMSYNKAMICYVLGIQPSEVTNATTREVNIWLNIIENYGTEMKLQKQMNKMK
jgi:hypothetical protein